MIPVYEQETGNLPPGIHSATWDEFITRYAYTQHRKALADGLALAIEHLSILGCQRIYVDGSYVTAKLEPGDYDACWEPSGVLIDRIETLFPKLWPVDAAHRILQKQTYGGDIFPAAYAAQLPMTVLDFFQQDKRTGRLKGIVALEIAAEP